MRRWTRTIAVGTISLLIFAAIAAAQNAPKQPKPLIPLKVNVVFNEYEGAKLVSRLPYTLSVTANDVIVHPQVNLRVGQRFPVWDGANNFNYSDVGTDIDCSAESVESGRYKISLVVRRTTLSSTIMVPFLPSPGQPVAGLPPASVTRKPPVKAPSSATVPEPIFSSFATTLRLIMHDGQTIQSTMATDPVSGHVIKVDVTLHVVKGQ